MNKMKRMTAEHKVIGGVCAGIAYVFEIPTLIVRLIFVMSLLGGVGPLPYLLLWLVIPEWDEAPDDYEDVCE